MANTGGKIECFIDVVSPYSYFALLYLLKNRDALATHGVEIEFIPMFLGGVNVGSGNKPPWMLPAKAAYGRYDFKRASRYFGVPEIKSPSFFPILSLLPQRALINIKVTYPRDVFENAFKQLFHHLWALSLDIAQPPNLATALSAAGFTPSQISDILAAAATPEVKEALNANTKLALEKGAFGAPWFWVTKAGGKGEPFFGSDRWGYMWEVLGVEWRDMEVVPKAKGVVGGVGAKL